MSLYFVYVFLSNGKFLPCKFTKSSEIIISSTTRRIFASRSTRSIESHSRFLYALLDLFLIIAIIEGDIIYVVSIIYLCHDFVKLALGWPLSTFPLDNCSTNSYTYEVNIRVTTQVPIDLIKAIYRQW